mmetsp:Transcript_201/g.336  ORF Transcript_201/g.336 Transcript_201/m.336 type:complete len:87 (+) Transcript_201:182-442(+)
MKIQRGVMITCDVPMKQFILHLNETRHFVLSDLDDTHLLVDPSYVSLIQEEIDNLMEKNVYTAPVGSDKVASSAGAKRGSSQISKS